MQKKIHLLSRALFLRSVLIITVSCVLALAANALRPNGIPLVQAWELRNLAVCTDGKRIPWLKLAEAQALFSKGEALFLDARIPEDYAEGHIQGAFNLPYDEFDHYLEPLLGELPATGPLITYCGGTDCHSSIELAIKLCDNNLGDVKIFFGGAEAWEAAGLPIE